MRRDKKKDKKGKEKPRQQKPTSASRPSRRPRKKGSVTRAVAGRGVVGADGRIPMTPQEMRKEYIESGIIDPQPSCGWN